MVGFEVEKVGEVRDARPARSKIRNLDFFFFFTGLTYIKLISPYTPQRVMYYYHLCCCHYHLAIFLVAPLAHSENM